MRSTIASSNATSDIADLRCFLEEPDPAMEEVVSMGHGRNSRDIYPATIVIA